MHRLQRVLALTALLSVMGGLAASWDASAQQGKRQARPAQQPRVIIRDRWLRGPPPPASSERNYYAPAPGVQQPMQRVPLPAPLAQPPTNR
jgi:hypothetical protein